MMKANNLADVANIDTSRDNLNAQRKPYEVTVTTPRAIGAKI